MKNYWLNSYYRKVRQRVLFNQFTDCAIAAADFAAKYDNNFEKTRNALNADQIEEAAKAFVEICGGRTTARVVLEYFESLYKRIRKKSVIKFDRDQIVYMKIGYERKMYEK